MKTPDQDLPRKRASVDAVELVYRSLHKAIIDGELAPGARLIEEEIAEYYNVSRTPVRAALSRLQVERLASRSTTKGLAVAQLSPEEIEDVYTVRASLEGLAARLSAYVALPQEIERLEGLQAEIDVRTSAGEIDRIVQLNFEFHRELHTIAKNSTLKIFMEQISSILKRYSRTTITQPGRAEKAIAEHHALIAAVKARDADAAEKIARTHMENAEKIRVAYHAPV